MAAGDVGERRLRGIEGAGPAGRGTTCMLTCPSVMNVSRCETFMTLGHGKREIARARCASAEAHPQSALPLNARSERSRDDTAARENGYRELNAAMISRWNASTCSRMIVRARAPLRSSSASISCTWSWTACPSPGTRSSTRYQTRRDSVK
jgi:hypothetical protein